MRFQIYGQRRDGFANVSSLSLGREANSRGRATFYSQGDETCRVREEEAATSVLVDGRL